MTPSETVPAPAARVPRLGLKAQLVLWWSAMVVLVLAGTGLVVYQQRRTFLEEQLEEKGHFSVRSLARILVDPLLESNYPQIQAFVREQAEADLVDYAVLEDLEGLTLASAGEVRLRSAEAESYARIARRRLRYVPLFDQYTILSGRDPEEPEGEYRSRRYREFSARVAPPGMDALGVLRVGYDTEHRIDQVVAHAMDQLAWVFLAAIPLGVLLSIVLAYWIARPIGALVEGAESIAGGDYDQAVEVRSPRELAVLAQSFDHMRVRIKTHIREIQEAYERLDRKVYELEVLYGAAERMNFKSYSPELLSYLLDTALSALDAEWGSLLMEDEADPPRLVVRMVRGAGFDRDTAVVLEKGEGIAGTVYETGNPVIANEGSRDARFARKTEQEELEERIRNLVCVPLMIENSPIGVFNLVNKRGEGGFDEDDLNLLTALASHAARSLENAKLYDQAIRESKTGLFVPRYFSARVNEEIVVSRRYDRVFSLVVLDIDHFKRINDTYGHLVGDEVLVKLARFVLATLRENIDVASRFGGEEFALLLPETDLKGAMQVAERLRVQVEADMEDPENEIPHVTISVGVAVYPHDAEEQDALFKVADEALYEAKENGRNQVRGGQDKRRYKGEAPSDG